MAPHPELAGVPAGHLNQVLLGQLLSGDGGVAQGEALLPPGQGVVGAPEGQVEGAVGQAVGEGGKLGVLVLHVLAAPQGQGAEPGAAGGLHHQGGGVLGHDEAHRVPVRVAGEGLHRLGEGEPVPVPEGGHSLLPGDVGADGEDQVIHRAEGGHGAGEDPPQAQVVQTVFIGHRAPLLFRWNDWTP